jgi:hypothetical protein
MNDRQRLEAIVDVVRSYLPPNGISREEAMNQIIALVDPLPEQPEQEPVDIHCPSCLHSFSIVPVAKREWVSLTEDEKLSSIWTDGSFHHGVEWAEAKLKEKNNG